MHVFKYIVVMLILSAEVSVCQTWKQLEIPLSACSYIAQNPWKPEQLFFLHHGVIAVTSDVGRSWEYRSFCDFVDQRPVSITFDSHDPNRWYLPMGLAGLMVTTDGGQSFSFKNEDLNPLLDYLEVIQHPTNKDVLYLRGNGVIQKSTDRGETWHEILLALRINTEEAAGFLIDEDDPSKLYVFATGKNRYYVSADGGSTWTTSPIEPGNFSRITKCSDGSIWGNNARSTDYGKTWVRYAQMEGFSGDFIGSKCQIVHDEGHDYYFLAMSNFGVYRARKDEWIWRPTGLARYLDSTRFGEISWIHFDKQAHAVWVVMRNEMYISLDDGENFEIVSTGPYLGSTSFLSSPSYKSDIIIGSTVATLDNGDTWQYNGWAMHTLIAGAVSPIDSQFIIMGTGRPLYTTQGFKSFDNFSFGFNIVPQNVYVYKTIKFNPHNPHELYGGSERGFWRLTDSLIINTIQHDNTLRLLTAWPSDRYFTTDFDFHPERDGEYYLATRSYNYALRKNQCHVDHSSDYGVTWRELYSEDGNVINAIIVHPDSADIIICASDRGIIRSVNAGSTWEKCNFQPFATAYIQTIAIDPRMPNVIYCGAYGVRYENNDPYTGGRKGGVYVSYDYGESWEETPMDGTYNYSVNQIHYHENPRRLIISTRAGIYEKYLNDILNIRNDDASPKMFSINTLFPNPIALNKSVTLGYYISENCDIYIDICDILGRKVQALSLINILPGSYELHFIPEVDASGIYLIKVYNEHYLVVKMLLIK